MKTQSYEAFEAVLVEILQGLPELASKGGPSLKAIAHVLTLSVHGFKAEAQDAEELRDMIGTLLKLTVASS